MIEENSPFHKILMKDKNPYLLKLYGFDSEGKKIDPVLEAQKDKSEITALQRRLDEMEGVLRKHGIDVDEHCREVEDDNSAEFVNSPW